MLNLLAQTVPSDANTILLGLAAVAIWLRIEHRLTRLEGLIDFLPCKTKKKDECQNE